MQQFLRLLFILWFVMVGAIIATKTVPIGHPCLKPVIVRNENQAATGKVIMDYRTSVSYGEAFSDPLEDHGLSPDGKHEFYVEISSNGYYSLNLMPPGQRQDAQRIHYSRNAIIPNWSADSTMLFVYEYVHQIDSHIPLRLFTMDILSGEIGQEFSPVPRILFQSPDYQQLFTLMPDNSDDRYQIMSIDSITGDATLFDTELSRINRHWSPDNNWMILWHVDQQHFSIIDPRTGNPHPVVNSPIEGEYSAWTDHSIWFSRLVDSNPEIWRVTLDDNSLSPVFQGGFLRSISSDDRWAIIDNPPDAMTWSFLYDTLSETAYSLSIRNADFSSDSRCMVAQIANTSGEDVSYDFAIYDLQTMQAVFVRENVRSFLTFDWYNGD